jgi:DNA mismatch repair protein MutS
MNEFSTPMMKQYLKIRQAYQDCLLFYRMGDFYELFLDDAHIGAKVLGITLTSRSKGKDGRIPMAGVPYHAVDSYLHKLVKAGYKVAICEQLSEPSSKGIVDRDVVRIVTPGTVLDEKALEKKTNNFIVSLEIKDDHIAFSIADISTGLFQTTEHVFTHLAQIIRDEFSRFSPTECILPPHLYENPDLLKILKQHRGLNLSSFQEWDIHASEAAKKLKQHFKVKTLASFGIEQKPLALRTSAALLGYFEQTQKHTLSHLRTLTLLDSNDFVHMDRSTMMNLELFSTLRERETEGSFLQTIYTTITAMGGRLLKQWITKPLHSKEEIEKRYEVVEDLQKNHTQRQDLRSLFEHISDIERVLSRLSVGIGNARDLISLKESLLRVLEVKELLSSSTPLLIHQVREAISPTIQEIIHLIAKTIVDEPPVSLREGGIIQKGIDSRLDYVRTIVGGGKEWLTRLEQTERERTGISSLKVRYNQVFGFYIEVSKSNIHLVPKDYTRKQTLIGGERFSTSELKEQEEIILTAQEEIEKLEYTIFSQTLDEVLTFMSDMQAAAESIAILDCLTAFAQNSERQRYVRPILLYSQELRIEDGRHPVVEQLLSDTPFVPNSVTLDPTHQQLLIITGPNMAGKSVFIRQVALIVLMAQIGSFVPASKARVSVVDRIFVRSGASDVITSGLSTFMVEMVETAYILHHATKHSLIVMDEIGRGTSTYDGISIASAVAEYLVTNPSSKAKTLFATHYHELQELEQKYPKQIKNFHMAVQDSNGEPVFLHTLLPGPASASFGINVAKLAGVPSEVIENAQRILTSLETQEQQKTQHGSLKEKKDKDTDALKEKLKKIDISRLTPLQALNMLAELQEKSQ